ncbi:MAG: IclR family transcriptional regulator [Chloroflexota bacterium]
MTFSDDNLDDKHEIIEQKNVLQSVARAFAILELLKEHTSGLLPKQVSRALELNLTTCYHQLNTLAALGYVQRDSQTGLFQLSGKITFRQRGAYYSAEVVKLLRPQLIKLQRATRETAYLSLWNGTEIYISDIVPSQQSIQVKLLEIGYSEANHAMAVGKAVLAQLDYPTLSSYIEQHALEPYTAKTITSAEQLLMHLEEVAAQGYSLDLGERFEDIYCLGVPIFGVDNQIVGSIGITTPDYRFQRNFDQFLDSLRCVGSTAERSLRLRSCVSVCD